MPAISFSGLASGIDGDAVIKAMMDARRLSTQPSKNTIAFNENENKALETLNSKLLKVSDVLKDFRSVVGNAISKRGVSSNDDAVSVSASNNARTGTTSITVQKLAQAATASFDNRFTSETTPLNVAGTLNLNVGSGAALQNFPINVTASMNLNDIVTAINSATNGKVIASAINVGTDSNPQFALMINGTETGIEKGTLDIQPDAALAAVLGTNSISQADDAVFTVSGIGQITRSSNNVTGLIPGVTFQLKQANNLPVAISVTDDRDKTAAKFDSVVGAINDLLKYIGENNTIERVEESGSVTNKYGDLAKTQVDNQIVSSIRDALADTNSGGVGTDVQIFADMGVTIERDGSYKFDSAKFVDALGKDPNGAEAVIRGFADKMANTNGVIDDYTKFQGQIDLAITSNTEENKTIQERLDQIEANLAKQTENLKMMFARLESRISNLNSQGAALNNSLAGLGSSTKK